MVLEQQDLLDQRVLRVLQELEQLGLQDLLESQVALGLQGLLELEQLVLPDQRVHQVPAQLDLLAALEQLDLGAQQDPQDLLG